MKLELFYPSKPFRVGQGFAENSVCANPDRTGIAAALPDGTCPDGKVKLYPLLGLAKGHTGLDLWAPDGAIIRAPFDGLVKETQLEPERGLGVGIITHEPVDMGPHGTHHAKARQWHGRKILARLGQEVRCGDPVMVADSTGYSSGSHNHFELKPVGYDGDGYHHNIFQDNGWFGAVDPTPFWNGMYAEDYASALATLRAIQAKVAYLLAQFFGRK